MRYLPFRWLIGPLVLAAVAGSSAWHALFAQDRAAPPRADPQSGSAAGKPWWDLPNPPPAGAPPMGGRLTSTQPPAPPAAPQAPVAAPGIHRVTRNMPGESKPIILDADEIAAWTEKSGTSESYVLLLRGLVLAQEGILQARFDQGAAWIDLTRYKRTGLLRLELYAEGNVRIDNGSIRDVPRAVLDLTTRGEFRFNAHKSKVLQESRAADPLIERGRAEGLGPPALRRPTAQAPATGVQPASSLERKLILPPTVTPAPGPNRPPVPGPPAAPPGPRSEGGAPPGAVDQPGLVQRRSYEVNPTEQPFAVTPGIPGQPAPTSPEVAPPPAATPPPAGPPGSAAPAPGPPPRLPDGSLPVPPPGSPAPAPRAPMGPPSRPTPPPPGPASVQTRNYTLAPRQGGTFNIKVDKAGPNGEQVIIATGGIILQVRNAPNVGLVDIEADRVVIWTRGKDAQQIANNLQTAEGTSNDLEFYLSGHVVLRQAPIINPKGEERTLRADEVYYDVNRNVAIAHGVQMEIRTARTPEPFFARALEMRQTSVNTFELEQVEMFSSKTPYAPGFKVYLRDAVLEDQPVPLKNIFGRPVVDRKTGKPVLVPYTLVTGHNFLVEMEDIPFFYLPYTSFNAREPLGPVQNFQWGYNHLFGIQTGVQLNAYELFGIQPQPNSRWRVNLDYLSYRGPGAGSTYDYSGTELFDVPARYTGQLKLFGMYDRGFDILGGARPVNNFDPPNFRGWGLWTNTIENLPYGFSVLEQVSGLSDRNFLEQYYKYIFDTYPNQATFLFVKQQIDNWDWSVLVEPRIRAWVTETQSLPRFDGWLIGQDFFQLLTYNTHVNLEYARLSRTSDPEPPVTPTDVTTSTARASWMQEVFLPFYVGPIKFLPYARAELTSYSQDLAGNTVGRAWGAGGLRASIPFTHLYPTVRSELWNLNGLNHKVVASLNYAYAYTNEPYTLFPQLDRLQDDAAEQSLRDINPMQFLINPAYGPSLVTNPLYQMQTYAIRRLNWYNIDTLDTIEVLQLDLRQRLQTKRGFPGNQHIVDWMTLQTSASYFPNAARDNFGHPWAFLEYYYLWNAGDRTALTSQGWADPFPGGPKVWTLGAYLNRPDRTNFYLGYRQIYPLNSQAVTASVTYLFSAKYSMTGSTTYDFGTQEAMANSLLFTRMGSDLQVSLGFTYNALQNNFGFLFNIVPNILPANRQFGPISATGGGGAQGLLQ